MRIVLSLAVTLGGVSVAAADGPEHRHWAVDGVRREALVYVPAGAKRHATPVVFAFHGHDGTMRSAEKEYAIETHWTEAIVVYMQGLPTPTKTDPKGKQPGWQYHVGDQGDRDLHFFDAVLTDLRHRYKVD